MSRIWYCASNVTSSRPLPTGMSRGIWGVFYTIAARSRADVGEAGDEVDELARLDRLRDMRLKAGRERADPILGSRVGRQRDRRRFGAALGPRGADPANELV